MDDKLPKVLKNIHQYLDEEETKFSQKLTKRSTLFDHSLRVAKFSQKIAIAELDDLEDLAFLGGLLHDVGKFKDGKYHVEGVNEEYRSARIAEKLLLQHRYNKNIIEKIVTAIKELYREDHCPTVLSRVIQDADNLDKLAELGVANFFLKAGLRGQGIEEELFYKMSIELTYAHNAIDCMWTKTGKQLAKKKSKLTIAFFKQFIKTVTEDGLFDLKIEKIPYQGRVIFSVFKHKCECGGKVVRKICNQKGERCNRINMQYLCTNCDKLNEVGFCSPKIRNVN